jgi:signal transduction histidine kinase
MTWSLRRRVVLTSGLILAVALSVCGVLIYDLVKSALNKSFDAGLTTQLQGLANMVYVDARTGDLSLQLKPDVQVEEKFLPAWYEISAKGHQGKRQTTNMPNSIFSHLASGTPTQPKIHMVTLPNGYVGRVAVAQVEVKVVDYHRIFEEQEKKDHRQYMEKMFQQQADALRKEGGNEDSKALKFESYDQYGHRFQYRTDKQGRVYSVQKNSDNIVAEATKPPVTVQVAVAQETSGLMQELSHIFWGLLILTGAALVVSELVMAWAMSRSLSPLNRLAQSIARIGEKNLCEPIRANNAPQELQPVVNHLNNLLKRIDAVLTRERMFSSDVSHELRTPLSGLMSTIDVCLRKQRDPENYHLALNTCRRIARQMQGVVVNLLQLARLESQSVSVECEPVDLHRLITNQWLIFAERATLKQITVKWRLTQGIALTQSEYVSQIIMNVFDNAISYVNEGGTITITSDEYQGMQRIHVSNTGCQIAEHDVEHIFERFWRGDRARTDVQLHCGLGLTLCRRLITLLKGTISARVQNNIFTVELRLPSANLDKEDRVAEQLSVDTSVVAAPEIKISSAHLPTSKRSVSARLQKRKIESRR